MREQLLAQQLGGEERLGLVGDHAVGVVARALRAAGASSSPTQRVDAVAGAGRQRHVGVELAQLGRPRPRGARRPSRRSARSILFTTRIFGVVDLLHELGDEPVAAPDRSPSPRRACTRRRPRASVGERALVGALAEQRARLVDAGRVEQHDLRCRAWCARRGSGVRVVCGRSETIATLVPTSRLTSVDFPTLGRPTSVTKPERNVTAVDASATSGRRVDGRRSASASATGVMQHRRDAPALRPARCGARGPGTAPSRPPRARARGG